jgi:hypothetical protein
LRKRRHNLKYEFIRVLKREVFFRQLVRQYKLIRTIKRITAIFGVFQQNLERARLIRFRLVAFEDRRERSTKRRVYHNWMGGCIGANREDIEAHMLARYFKRLILRFNEAQRE